MCWPAAGVAPTIPTTVPQWRKFIFSHTDFQIAALTKTISLLSLVAGAQVEGIKVFEAVRFTGTGLGQYQISCGDPAAVDSLSPAWDVAVPVSNSNIQLLPLLVAYDEAAATALTITATADVNLNLSTAGSLFVWLKLARLI